MLASVSINEIKDLLIISIAAITPILHAIKAALEAYSSFLKTRAEINAQPKKNKRGANSQADLPEPRQRKLKASDIFFLVWQMALIVFLLFFVELSGWSIFFVLIAWSGLIVFFVMRVVDRILILIFLAVQSEYENFQLMKSHFAATEKIVGILGENIGIKNTSDEELESDSQS